LVKHLPEATPPLYEMPFKISNHSLSVKSSLERWEQKMWWLFPVNTHQLFIAFINSISIVALLWIPIVYAQVVSRLFENIVVSFVVFWLSIIANDTYAKIKMDREIAKYNFKMAK